LFFVFFVWCFFILFMRGGGGGGCSLYVRDSRIRRGLSRLSIGGAITPFSIPLPDVMLD